MKKLAILKDIADSWQDLDVGVAGNRLTIKAEVLYTIEFTENQYSSSDEIDMTTSTYIGEADGSETALPSLETIVELYRTSPRRFGFFRREPLQSHFSIKKYEEWEGSQFASDIQIAYENYTRRFADTDDLIRYLSSDFVDLLRERRKPDEASWSAALALVAAYRISMDTGRSESASTIQEKISSIGDTAIRADIETLRQKGYYRAE